MWPEPQSLAETSAIVAVAVTVTVKGTQTLCCLFTAQSWTRLATDMNLFEAPKYLANRGFVVIPTISPIRFSFTRGQLNRLIS